MTEPVLQSFRAHSTAVLQTHLCCDLLLGLSLTQTKFPILFQEVEIFLRHHQWLLRTHLLAFQPWEASHQPQCSLLKEVLSVSLVFVEMLPDSHYAHLNQMVSQGRFEHVGHASILLEGATA